MKKFVLLFLLVAAGWVSAQVVPPPNPGGGEIQTNTYRFNPTQFLTANVTNISIISGALVTNIVMRNPADTGFTNLWIGTLTGTNVVLDNGSANNLLTFRKSGVNKAYIGTAAASGPIEGSGLGDLIEQTVSGQRIFSSVDNGVTASLIQNTYGFTGDGMLREDNNWGEWLSKSLGAKLAKLLNGETNQANIVLFGDSWVANGRIWSFLHQYFTNKYGDAGPGWCGLVNTPPSPSIATYVGTGWVVTDQSATAVGVDIASVRSTNPTDYGIVRGYAEGITFHYLMVPGGGDFTWQVDGGATTTVHTDNATTQFNSVTIEGQTTNVFHDYKFAITVAGTNGVTMMGGDLHKAQPGIRVHQVGNSGLQALQAAAVDATIWEAGLAALNPDMVIILLGVNDCAQNFTTSSFTNSMATITARIQAAAPRCDVIFLTPADIGLATTYPMSAYVRQEYELAKGLGVGFYDSMKQWLTYSLGNNLGLYENTSHINTNGAKLLTRSFVRRLADTLAITPEENKTPMPISGGGTGTNAVGTGIVYANASTLSAGTVTANTLTKGKSSSPGVQDSNVTDDGTTVTVGSLLKSTGNITLDRGSGSSGATTFTISTNGTVVGRLAMEGIAGSSINGSAAGDMYWLGATRRLLVSADNGNTSSINVPVGGAPVQFPNGVQSGSTMVTNAFTNAANATASVARWTAAGMMTNGAVNASSELTGLVPTVNGGTGASGLTGIGYFNGGSPMTAGTLTANTVPKGKSSSPGVQDSNITDDGSTVTINSVAKIVGNTTIDRGSGSTGATLLTLSSNANVRARVGIEGTGGSVVTGTSPGDIFVLGVGQGVAITGNNGTRAALYVGATAVPVRAAYGITMDQLDVTNALTLRGFSGLVQGNASSQATAIAGAGAGAMPYFLTSTTVGSTATGSSGNVLTLSGSTPTWGSVPTGSMPALTGEVITSAGGVATTYKAGTQFGLPYFATTTTHGSTAAGTSSQVLLGNASGAPTWGNVPTAALPTVTEAKGGSGTDLSGAGVGKVFFQGSSIFDTGDITYLNASDSLTIGSATGGTWGVGVVRTNTVTLSDAAGYFSNQATSSTASILRSGIEAGSTGTWNGSGATAMAIHLNAVSGGTLNYGIYDESGQNSSFQLDVQTRGGNLVVSTAGKGLQIKTGANAKMGTAVLTGGTVVVSTTAITAASYVFLSNGGAGGTIGALYEDNSARVAGTSFTIKSSSVLDSSGVYWMIVEPAP